MAYSKVATGSGSMSVYSRVFGGYPEAEGEIFTGFDPLSVEGEDFTGFDPESVKGERFTGFDPSSVEGEGFTGFDPLAVEGEIFTGFGEDMLRSESHQRLAA